MDELTTQILGYTFIMALLIVPVWKTFSRAGFPPAQSLLIFVPFAGLLITALLLALRRWPRLEPER